MTRDQLLVRRRPGDLETPVSAMLKLGADAPGSFLFESIHGGERLGRYSFIGLHPQRWLRVLEGVGEESMARDFTGATKLDLPPLEALRAFADQARADADPKEDLPPMASGAFGYIGYDFIQHVEPVEIFQCGAAPPAAGIFLLVGGFHQMHVHWRIVFFRGV